MWYDVDFMALAQQYLMTGLRRATSLRVVNAFLNPLVGLHYRWKQLRQQDLYEIEHTGQVCYLRGALNDSFDPELRRIYIDGAMEGAERNYIYTPAEQQPRYLGTLYLHTGLEYADTGADFTVYVPTEIMESTPFEVRALIDFYRAGGKRYLIIEI